MNEKKIQMIVDNMLLASGDKMLKGLSILSPEEQKIAEQIIVKKIEDLGLHRDVRYYRPVQSFPDTQVPYLKSCYTLKDDPVISDGSKKAKWIIAETKVILYHHQEYNELKALRQSENFTDDPETNAGWGMAFCAEGDHFNKRHGRIIATIRAIKSIKTFPGDATIRVVGEVTNLSGDYINTAECARNANKAIR